MTSDQFAYWLQGFTELHGEPPTPEQWEAIKDHLKLVFAKVTPNRQQAPSPQILPSLQPLPKSPNDWVQDAVPDYLKPRFLQPGMPWLETTVIC